MVSKSEPQRKTERRETRDDGRGTIREKTTWLHRFTQFVALATFVLIIAGGLVTSTGSGLSVPDWPLSYGKFFPPMIGGIRFEHTHRVIAGFVGLLTLILMVWLLRKEKRKTVRWMGIAAFMAVLAQSILGGISVIHLLPTAVSVIHACLAQTFFCLIATIAAVTSPEWEKEQPRRIIAFKPLHRLLIFTVAFIYLQLIAGSIVRHTAAKHGLYLHFVGAFLVLVHALLVFLKMSKAHGNDKILARSSLFLGLLVLVQIFLGFGAFIFKVMIKKTVMPRSEEVFFATAHQATGALILATSVLLTLWYFKLSRQFSYERG